MQSIGVICFLKGVWVKTFQRLHQNQFCLEDCAFFIAKISRILFPSHREDFLPFRPFHLNDIPINPTLILIIDWISHNVFLTYHHRHCLKAPNSTNFKKQMNCKTQKCWPSKLFKSITNFSLILLTLIFIFLL